MRVEWKLALEDRLVMGDWTLRGTMCAFSIGVLMHGGHEVAWVERDWRVAPYAGSFDGHDPAALQLVIAAFRAEMGHA